jgi:DNA (cytosine-5)-methyltransferase 1
MVFYSEFDAGAAAWLAELAKDGHIPSGRIDQRDIRQVQASDCGATSHFFAGIGGWPYALRLAGWPDDLPVWTGSCPCQPFSCAGKREGEKDKRHLWPEFRRLIAECCPAIAFGEQVASKAGREWLAGVRADLEGMGYAVGAADLCAAGVGAPHIRQRLFWVAYAGQFPAVESRSFLPAIADGGSPGQNFGISGKPCRVDDAAGPRCTSARGGESEQPQGRRCVSSVGCEIGGLGDSQGRGCGVGGDAALAGRGGHAIEPEWARFNLIPCRDGKARRVESGSFPLVAGFPGRVGLLRGYGNAIVPQVAAEFIRAVMEVLGIARLKADS